MSLTEFLTFDPRARKVVKVLETTLFYLVILFFLVMFLSVFVWMILTSLKLPRDVSAYPPIWVFKPTLNNYQTVLTKTPMALYFKNSMIIACFSVTISMLLSLPAAYSIAKFKQRRLSMIILIVRMLPGIVFGLPFFVIYRLTGLIDTYAGLIIIHLTLVVPLATWVLIGFFEDVPPELEDAARIDGASRVGTFLRIAIPLAAPGMAVAAILGFIASWNNFIFVLILGGGKTTTLPMAVYNFMVFEDIQFGPLAAAATLITLPIIVIALFAQRYLVAGLSMGAVKG